jgi:5-methylcytosine-specific restriction endonuclease McrA
MEPTLATIAPPGAPAAPKTVDPRYKTRDWLETRERVLLRDLYRCWVKGCRARAFIVDHIVSPRNGGSDDDSNLRSTCRLHDNRFKEDHTGRRRGGG